MIYTTVYLIERSLSLDNLFVFILLFAYFAVPYELRARLLFWGIVFALDHARPRDRAAGSR